ncbi:GDSL-type esterase/lipase family protein [Streptomyces sp. NPDC051644]|uniref:GDSL-type esterase/lipase family protein n=1 Tax=Streptomyces sp. NPDC051644 TaxID=3365666 RepID=UPI00379D0E5A
MVKQRMCQSKRTPVMLTLFSLLVSLLVLVPTGTANAAESIPPLQWSTAPTIGRLDGNPVASTNGDITLPCSTSSGGSDLTTYNASGQVVRQISRTSVIDGVTNCLNAPVVAKNGDIYGVPFGQNSGGSYVSGPNLLAYSGNTLKWKYPLVCGYDQGASYAVGANGNIYSTVRLSDGVHLIGLTPEVAAGQTTPTKVLDVKISNDCGMALRTYKDGVVLHGQSSGNAWYYSYSGKFLGQATIGSIWDEKLNAEGQLFVPSYVAGSGFRSISVSRYDPTTGSVKWTVSASQPGADTNGVQLFPTPGGGLVVLMTEQHMVSDGVPATPKTWEKRLVTINASGQKVRSNLLADTFANGTFGGTYLTAESGGKVVVAREMNLNTGVPGISMQTYDPVNNTWPYQQTILGDPNASGGPYGYALEYASGQPANAVTNTLYVRVRCSGNCPVTNRKLLALTVSGVGVDYPQGDVFAAYPRAAASYVAIGDSFSSGEGVPPFAANTDVPGVNMCHRSDLAYAKLIAGTSTHIPSLGTNGFRACSGAVTANIWDTAQANEGIQTDRFPDTTTQLVTITIGGNDIGFSALGKACVLGTCQVGSTEYNTSLNAINNTLPGALTETYQKVLTQFPNAKVYVMDYPQVVAAKAPSDPFDIRCAYMFNSGSNTTGSPYYPWEDAWAARNIVTQLDAKISNAITSVRGMNADYYARLHYVPTNGSGSPFAGHSACDSSASYFNNVDTALGHEAYAFHPNANGQGAYATTASTAINAG